MSSELRRARVVSVIAITGEQFRDFAPYVAAASESGVVAFQAALPAGGSAVFIGDGTSIRAVTDAEAGPFREVCSHPDIGPDGRYCVYAALRSGGRGVFVIQGGKIETIWESHGPLGPTLNGRGDVAFRAELASGEAAILARRGGITVEIARAGPRFAIFHGLPVIDDAGVVVFRADLTAGGQAICAGDGVVLRTVAETGGEYTGLGTFPCVNSAGAVAFCAERRAGDQGVFVSSPAGTVTIADSIAGFESFRGVLIDDAGRVVYYATPIGGALGVYTGPDPGRDLLLAIGAPLLGSTVTEFALNPVSISSAGRLAIRVRLADGRQAIVRADPARYAEVTAREQTPRKR